MQSKNADQKNLYPEFSGLNLPAIDTEMLEFWSDHQIFEASVSTRENAEPFVFFEGPPSANGKPGIHHVMGRTIKDIFCRYKTLKGFKVERKAGWDTHGLPVELGVEKKLGISKKDIGTKISVEDYNKACKESVLEFQHIWDDLTVKMGYWVDLKSPYITYTKEYIETLWSMLGELYKKDLLYKGYTIQPFSPAAGTQLSSHELNMPGCYRDVKDTSATALFKIDAASAPQKIKDLQREAFFAAWTTTPWTLPSNTALTVGKNIEYSIVETYNAYTFELNVTVIATDLIHKYFKPEQLELDFDAYQQGDKKIPYRVLDTLTGADLVGTRYEQLFAYEQPEEGDAFKVIAGDFVTTSDGTGIVHTAPSFGADDMMVAKQNGIGALTLVNAEGRFKDTVTDFAGRAVKDFYNEPDYRAVDIDISIWLKQNNRALKVEKYEHSYPHCWRTDKPVIYYPLSSWFIRTTAVKDRLIELNKTIHWKPASTGEGRFGQWLENLMDWNLSRSRFWGTPLNIWRTADGEEEICISNFDQLNAEVQKAVEAGLMDAPLADDFDPHRPYVDDIVLVSPKGEPMHREADLIDVWFDSGAMPYAQWHYPFNNEAKFKASFPADFIAEGVDQTRGWFFTLHALAVMLHDSVAFKNVVSNGLVLDKNGQKMSKRLGNAVDPFTTLEKYGADATRWYMISNAQPWDNLKFDVEGIGEVSRKMFGTLYNTYSFFALYANIDRFDFNAEEVPHTDRPEMDRWILSLLNSLIQDVDEAYAEYEPTKAARAIQNFIDRNLSNWYVRLSRRVFWKPVDAADEAAVLAKKSAYQTLYRCMVDLAKMISPIAPFFSDFLYQNLNKTTKREDFKSVHLAYFPAVDANQIDKALEERMELAQRISSLSLSLRKKEKIKVRQPLAKVLIPINDAAESEPLKLVEKYFLSEINVKEADYVMDTAGIFSKSIKPDFKKLGPKFGKNMKQVAQTIQAFDQNQIATLEQKGQVEVEIDGAPQIIELSDTVISTEDVAGFLTTNDDKITVALDITITDELADEGVARELVNKIQNLRKDSGFNVTDRIGIEIETTDKISAALKRFENYICNEVLAENIHAVNSLQKGHEIDINGEQVKVEVATIG